MSKKQKKDKFSMTICGEFFPEVYPSFRSQKWSRGEEDPFMTEMRLFCACQRWAFNRLLEGASRDEIKKLGQELFGLNSRYADDARLKAQALLDSQKELLELEIGETENKLSRARKKLGIAMRKLAKAEEKGNAPDIVEKLHLAVKGRNNRVVTLEKKLAELESHRENGTIPKVVFGGRKLWKKVCKGRATQEEWRASRKNRLYSRGDETKGGNPNIKVTYREGEFYLAVTISHLSEKVGEDALGRPKMSRAPRVEGRLWLPEKYRDLVRMWLAMKLPYTVELIRTLEGRYIVYMAFDLGGVREPNFTKGCLAMDTNPDGVALCNVNASGQPEPWPEDFNIPYPGNLGKYEGEFQVITYPNGFLYIRVHDLAYACSFRRDYLIGVLARVITDVAFFLGKPIVLEDLDFGKDGLDTNKKFNRMASNFPFAKMVEAVCRKAVKEGVPLKLVPARHTSTIGYWKYTKRYAVPVHCAAALVIGRRAMDFKERVTKELKQVVVQIKQNLTCKVKPYTPREGRGMTRGVRACLRRLEGKLLQHNGLVPWQQEAYYSVWHDLKKLALS
ncbi:IS200/IS605 family element transposase accessory protein TnpB [Carboxydothermus ferrireducens]|uniref:IS605 OrfB family transposase n=1 Tax=Carboxydothermus ferrireducens DSM 11255 TaxID=1119529 RepID=A0ABX2RC56_9THEO|nr:IS200/IS605 family element transposase accessory protein TnpB [Carboxydothermus ferrireducens]NYE58773.1 IS605 OrfB family transposase [Carboxydothermus ferrireducens DSM 11255]